MVVKVRKVGNSLAVTLPVEVASSLNVSEGDSLFLVKQEGGYAVTPFDPDFKEAMDIWRATARRYRNAFKALA